VLEVDMSRVGLLVAAETHETKVARTLWVTAPYPKINLPVLLLHQHLHSVLV
jgi:hypothetical protein